MDESSVLVAGVYEHVMRIVLAWSVINVSVCSVSRGLDIWPAHVLFYLLRST
jgi:hypothetical protein